MEVTNNAKRLEGVHTTGGIVYLKPGETRELNLTDDGAKLAGRLPFLKIGKGDPATSEPPSERDELKKQAAELGIEYPKNISTEKLKELIDAKLAA